MFRLSVASVLALFGVAAASSCPAYQLYGDYTVTPSSLSAGQVGRRPVHREGSVADPPLAAIHRREQLHVLERPPVPGQAPVHRLLHRGHEQHPRGLDVPDPAHQPARRRRVQPDGTRTPRL
jgi:hypothetical protein